MLFSRSDCHAVNMYELQVNPNLLRMFELGVQDVKLSLPLWLSSVQLDKTGVEDEGEPVCLYRDRVNCAMYCFHSPYSTQFIHS